MIARRWLKYVAGVMLLFSFGETITPPASAATFEWTQATRWREDAPLNTRTRKKYPEQFFPAKGYDVRPHEQLAYMFPMAISGFGNNKETSDNLWVEMYNSPRVIGNSTNLTRAKDIVEDFQINFISPFSFTYNYYFHFYTDNSSSYLLRSAYPLTLSGGPNAGEALLGNNRLIAVGDDNTLWYDNDGTFSVYNYPNGNVEYDSTVTHLNGGPAGWAGASLASKLSQFIGYEQSNYYFLEGDNTLIVYNRYMNHVRTDEVLLDGELWGHTLAELVDGAIPNTLYLGWDLGPIVAFVYPDYGGNPPVAANTYNWTHTARWLEDARVDSGPVIYQQEADGLWDSRPHQQLRSMYPSDLVGDGNNQATSDNLWKSILTSENLIGNSGAPVRAVDAMEDFHYNFIDPAVADRSYYFYFYHDNDTLWLHRSSFPLTLSNGPNAGEYLINNTRLLAVGDDNTLWLDTDNTLSYYNYPGGTLEYDSTVSAFPQGPPGWIGVPVVENLNKLIGYEQALLYFLEGESTVHVFLYSTLAYIRTDVVELDGDLAGHTLREIIDHEVPGVTYGGWDLGPVFIMVDTAPDTSVVDHFRFDYDSSALTCNPQSVTIKACADASCSTLYTDPVEVTLAPSGWTGGNTFTINGGSATTSLAYTSPGTVSLSVASSSPAKTGSDNICSIDSGAYSPLCELTFQDAGFLIEVPDFISGKGAADITVSAVQKDNVTNSCSPAFVDVTKTVGFWTHYADPVSGSMAASLDGVPLSANAAFPSLINLNFDGTGQATLPLFNYYDAGAKVLHLSYEGAGPDSGLILTGSDTFVARPAGLCVSAGVSCTAPYPECNFTQVAGQNFNLSVTAVAWQSDGDTDYCSGNSGTPNYSDVGLTLSSAVISPSGGSQGAVAPTDYDHTAEEDGLNVVEINQSEVGVFYFYVTPPLYKGAALGSTESLVPVIYSSASSARFIPESFDAAVVEPGSLDPACISGNTYIGQSMRWLMEPKVRFTALNAQGNTTGNYTETGFMKLTADQVFDGVETPLRDTSVSGNDGALLYMATAPDNQYNTGAITVSSPGVLDYEFSVLDTISYDRRATAEVAPFTPDLSFTLSDVTDGEVSLSNSPVFSPASGSISMRYGRMELQDTFGPETTDLRMPVSANYFDGTTYQINDLDNCTVWDSLNASVSAITQITSDTGQLSAGESIGGGLTLEAPVSVPGLPDTGEAMITYDAPAWLEGDYDGDGSNEDPTGNATFGVYRGHERLIFKREVR